MANKTPGSSLTFREFVMLMSKIEDDLKIMFMKFDIASDSNCQWPFEDLKLNIYIDIIYSDVL